MTETTAPANPTFDTNEPDYVPLRLRLAAHLADHDGLPSEDEDWLPVADVALDWFRTLAASERASAADLARHTLADKIANEGMRAFCDPGQFVQRRRDDDGDYEPLYDWQRHALRTLLDQLIAPATANGETHG